MAAPSYGRHEVKIYQQDRTHETTVLAGREDLTTNESTSPSYTTDTDVSDRDRQTDRQTDMMQQNCSRCDSFSRQAAQSGCCRPCHSYDV